MTIPILRVPTPAELAASGVPDPSLFDTTVVIPVPTLGELLAAMQPQPQPTPASGPAFRTQEEAPPVVDSGGGGGGRWSSRRSRRAHARRAAQVIGLLILTYSGGFSGYRQANSALPALSHASRRVRRSGP